MMTRDQINAERAEHYIRAAYPDWQYMKVYRNGKEYPMADEIIRALKREGHREAYESLRSVLGIELGMMAEDDRR